MVLSEEHFKTQYNHNESPIYGDTQGSYWWDPPNPELLISQCLPFLSVSLLSGLNHQDYSSIPLSFLNTIAKWICLVVAPAFYVPTKQQLICQTWCCSSRGWECLPPPSLSWLSPLSSVHLKTAGTFGSPHLWLFSLSLTNTLTLQKSLRRSS